MTKRSLFLCPIVLIATLSSATAHAIIVVCDELSITRDGTAFFNDPFNDGMPPPSAPNFASGTSTSYSVTGTIPSDAESGGSLLLDTANGAITTNADGTQRQSLILTLLTSATGGATQIGTGNTFAETGVFNLTTPPGPQYSTYGIRLSDSLAGVTHQVLQLGVEFDPTTGKDNISYLFQNFDAHTITLLGSTAFAPPAGANGIRMNLARSDTTNDDVVASFSFLSGGSVVGNPFTFSTPGLAFQVDDFVRGQILVSEAVPEPGSLGLLACGLTCIAVLSHQRRRR